MDSGLESDRSDAGQPLVVVTGASSGIGRAVAAAFAREGHPLLCLARRMRPSDAPGSAAGVRCASVDVADFDAFAAAVADAEASFGPVGCLVNGAGMADGRPFDQVEPTDYEREIASDLIGVLHGVTVVLAGMAARQSGTIINVSSISDRKTSPVAVAYTAAKYGVRAASECLREASAARGVRVINIAPGYVRTNIHEHMGITFDRYRELLGHPDFLSPEEVAAAIVWCYQLPRHICVRDLVITPTRSTF